MKAHLRIKASFHMIAGDRRSQKVLRSYGNTLLRSCDHMETKVLRSKCIP